MHVQYAVGFIKSVYTLGFIHVSSLLTSKPTPEEKDGDLSGSYRRSEARRGIGSRLEVHYPQNNMLHCSYKAFGYMCMYRLCDQSMGTISLVVLLLPHSQVWWPATGIDHNLHMEAIH